MEWFLGHGYVEDGGICMTLVGAGEERFIVAALLVSNDIR